MSFHQNVDRVSTGVYLLGQLAGLVWAVEDLVVKDGEVEGEAEPDGVGGL